MSYGRTMRLITTKQGYREIKDYIKENSKGNYNLSHLIKFAEINKKVKDLVFLGWTDRRSSYVDEVRDIVMELHNRGISYRYIGLGDYRDDIEESDYTAPKDRIKEIPYISIIREFDDEDIYEELEIYAKVYEEEKLNDMEVE